MSKLRTETDSLGSLKIDDKALYGIQTMRAALNFPISGETVPFELINAYALLKKACAKANLELKHLKKDIATPIIKACDEIMEDKHHEQFIVDIFQAGAGTSTNMNLNEVIANRALEIMKKPKGSYGIISPNDHVNMAQSTNDTYPTAMRIAIAFEYEHLDKHLKLLQESLEKASVRFRGVIKSARTHLQDAVPITLGQEFDGWARTIKACRSTLAIARGHICTLGIGGSAAGTGINTHPDFRKKVLKHLNTYAPFFRLSDSTIESMQSQKDIQRFMAALKETAIEISRIASDLRLLASGPNTGFSEITLPAVQPGSSIMPGKVNPSILECVNMVCYRIMGAEATVSLACLSGQLELNVNMPLMTSEVLYSMEILENAATIMAEKCINGITANETQCKKYAYGSAGLATVLNPLLGYEKVAEIVKESTQNGISLIDILRTKKLFSESELKKLLDPQTLTKPNRKK